MSSPIQKATCYSASQISFSTVMRIAPGLKVSPLVACLLVRLGQGGNHRLEHRHRGAAHEERACRFISQSLAPLKPNDSYHWSRRVEFVCSYCGLREYPSGDRSRLESFAGVHQDCRRQGRSPNRGGNRHGPGGQQRHCCPRQRSQLIQNWVRVLLLPHTFFRLAKIHGVLRSDGAGGRISRSV